MAVDHLMTKLPNEDEIDDELKAFRDKGAENHEQVVKLLEERGTSKKVKSEEVDLLFGLTEKTAEKKTAASRSKKVVNIEDPDDDDISIVSTATKPAARGRGRGRGSRGVRGRGAAASGRAMPQLDISMGSKTNTSSRQPTLLDAMNQKASSRTRAAPKIVYEVSSDSE